ncbi:MAG TPA: copper transporter [Actinomycetota bacterium]|nr:copper transporter [Actinomycetota bacterium]
MIDFRYHIVSIVAVFLALGIGLLMGSGVLGDPLLDNIRDRARDVQSFNDRLKDDVGELEHELSVARDFTVAVEPMLVDGRLAGEDVVIVDVAAGDVPLDELLDTLEDGAGATVSSILTLTDDFELGSQEDVEDLASITGSDGEPEELRVEAARKIGTELGALADVRRRSPARADVIDDLEDAGFLDVAAEEEAVPVPAGASLVVAASGSSDATWRIDEVVTGLAHAAATAPGMGPVVVVETTDSAWGVAGSVRGDGDLGNVIGTVDNVDRLTGRIALVMALGSPPGEEPGHYGEKSLASSLIPEPSFRD